MFMVNIKDVDNKVGFCCTVVSYLELLGLVPIGVIDGKVYFANNDKLKDILSKSPFYIKLLSRF